MIPTIGIMVGAYIFARLLEMITAPNAKSSVQLVCVLAMLVDVVCVFSLMMSGPSPGMR